LDFRALPFQLQYSFPLKLKLFPQPVVFCPQLIVFYLQLFVFSDNARELLRKFSYFRSDFGQVPLFLLKAFERHFLLDLISGLSFPNNLSIS
jgi:hypothetical protein